MPFPVTPIASELPLLAGRFARVSSICLFNRLIPSTPGLLSRACALADRYLPTTNKTKLQPSLIRKHPLPEASSRLMLQLPSHAIWYHSQPIMGKIAHAQSAGDALRATYCSAGPSCYDMIINRLHPTKMKGGSRTRLLSLTASQRDSFMQPDP